MQTMTRDFSSTQLQTVRAFFTEDEWDAIDSSLADYQDYGEDAAAKCDSVGEKMSYLFSRTVG